MGLRGTTDSSVYVGLKDVLQRHPVVSRVTYEPDAIVKRFLRAAVDPARVVPPTGPTAPTIDVEWRFVGEDQFYRIHYADPNTGFNCGWHRDDDHPDLGDVHFQYERAATGDDGRVAARFEKTVPTEILWNALDRLFEERVQTLTSE